MQTTKLIVDLEEELFSRFGWTIRVYVSKDKYVVYMQIMSVCGHKPIPKPGKI